MTEGSLTSQATFRQHLWHNKNLFIEVVDLKNRINLKLLKAVAKTGPFTSKVVFSTGPMMPDDAIAIGKQLIEMGTRALEEDRKMNTVDA